MDEPAMKRCLLLLAASLAAQGHDIITTAITFDRDVSRIFATHCAACHHPDGTAFSLMTYAEARPWAVAIKEEILRRRMPPWGAIKGFGDFRNDNALTPEEIERIVSWTDGGVPEGDAKDLPAPPKSYDTALPKHPRGELLASGDLSLTKAFTLDGLWPKTVPDSASIQITAEPPDGAKPLLWLQNYRAEFGHPFLLQMPLKLPAHTVIHGIPAGASVALMPPGPSEQAKH
jgi:hypothetical protein